MKRRSCDRGGSWPGWDGLRVLTFVLASLAWAGPVAGQRPAVTSVSPKSVQLEPGGEEVEILLQGVGLAAFRTLVVESRGRAVRSIRATASPDRNGQRVVVVIVADPSAAGLRVDLVLTDGRTRIPIPGIEVLVAEMPPPFRPVSWAADGLTMTGRRFAPMGFSVDGLFMTGRRFAPLTFGTDALTMTGRRFTPVRITTPAISMIGRRLQGGTP